MQSRYLAFSLCVLVTLSIVLVTLLIVIAALNVAEHGNTPEGITNDTTAPVITIDGNDAITLYQNEQYTQPSATCSDSVSGDLPVTVLPKTIPTETTGEFTVTFTCTDVAGNSASRTLAVNVIELIDPSDRAIDVLMYGYRTDNIPGSLDYHHKSLLESKGYTVATHRYLGDLTDIHDAKVTIIAQNTRNFDPTIVAELKRYVENGGRLLLVVNTEYQTCDKSLPDDPRCNMDFTVDTFGFRFDGSVQYSTLYPAPGQSTHPIWTHPNKVSRFDDWCCDAYVSEIIDTENITVVSTVSGSSYIPSGYYTVRDVPAIVVNNNPDFDGGMVIGAGIQMMFGWNEPDLRLFENTMEYMISGDPADDTTDR